MEKRCPTCHNPKCGNYAACERRHKAYMAWRREWLDMWETIGVLAGLLIKVRLVLPEATPMQVTQEYLHLSEQRAFKQEIAALFLGGKRR